MMSVMLGLIASVLPNWIFKYVYFRSNLHTTSQIVKNLYWSAILKVIGLILLLGLILQLAKLEAWKFILAFIFGDLVCKLYYWLNLLRVSTE